MKSLSHQLAATSVIAIAAISFPGLALAQSDGGTPKDVVADASADTQGVGDIIVTAQKRSERLQDVPVSVAAFGSAALAQGNITSAMEMQRLVPALTLTTSASGVQPFLRGIGNPSTTPGNEPSTALYIDGVYYPRLPNSAFNLNNVERVEVLKGPQGTLFGRNAVGGLIQIITKDPSFTPGGEIKLGYGNYNQVTGSAYLTTGITDWVAADIAVQGLKQYDGWGKNINTGEDYGYENNISVRSKWLFRLGAETDLKLAGSYQKAKTTIGTPANTYRGTIQAAPSAPNVPLYPVGFYDSRNGGDNVGRNESHGLSATFEHGFDFADLTAVTAWSKSKERNTFDFDYTADRFLLLNLNVSTRMFSQEIRLSGKTGSPVAWTVGGYFSNIKAQTDPTIQSGTLLGSNKAISYVYQTTKSWAAFAQATVPVLEDTNLTGGIRYSNDKLESTGRNDVERPTGYTTGTTLPLKTQSYERVNFKVSIDHHFDQHFMVYASYSTGYKAGTYNLSAADAQPPAAPEAIKAWELGFKSQWFNNRLRLNMAAFHYDIDNPQVQIRNGTVFQLINAGGARSRGIEADGDLLLTEGLTFRFSGSLLDAKYNDFANAPIVTQRPVTPPYGNTPFFIFDASGSRITRAPKFTGNAGLDYKFETSVGRFNLSASYAYNDGFFWTVDQQIRQKAYSLIDASIGYQLSDNDAWRFQLWGKNLNGAKYYAYGTESAGLAGFSGAPAAPRTYGISVGYKF